MAMADIGVVAKNTPAEDILAIFAIDTPICFPWDLWGRRWFP